MIHPVDVCERCKAIIVDGWPSVLMLSRPGSRARVAPLCPVCVELVEATLRPTETRLPELEVVNV